MVLIGRDNMVNFALTGVRMVAIDIEKRKDIGAVGSVVVFAVDAAVVEAFVGSELLVANKPVPSTSSLDKPVVVAVEELGMNCLPLAADL